MEATAADIPGHDQLFQRLQVPLATQWLQDEFFDLPSCFPCLSVAHFKMSNLNIQKPAPTNPNKNLILPALFFKNFRQFFPHTRFYSVSYFPCLNFCSYSQQIWIKFGVYCTSREFVANL